MERGAAADRTDPEHCRNGVVGATMADAGELKPQELAWQPGRTQLVVEPNTHRHLAERTGG